MLNKADKVLSRNMGSSNNNQSVPLANSQVLGTLQSVQAQAKAAMTLLGSVDRTSESHVQVNNIKTTPPPKLHPIRRQNIPLSPQLFQIENVTTLANGEIHESANELTNENDNSKNNQKIISEEVETLSAQGNVFGLMRAFYTVTVPDHRPTAHKQFFCNFCKCKTWDQQVFLDHITSHLFVCGLCSFRTFSRADVVSHIIKKHPNEKGELPSLHAMHLQDVNLQFQGNKDGEKPSVSNALAGSEIVKTSKEDCLPITIGSKANKESGQDEFKNYLANNVDLADNEVIYLSSDKDDDDVIMQDDDSKTSSNSSMNTSESEKLDDPTVPCKELGTVKTPNDAELERMGVSEDSEPEKGANQMTTHIASPYQCTNCSFTSDSIEMVKEHFVKKHSGGSSVYKSLPIKYYCLICPYCMLQMHDPEEIQHHLHLRHYSMLRKLVVAIRPVATGPYTYVCNQCGASSPVKENMLGHILLEHETEHLLDTLLYIYKAGVSRFIEHIRELIRQTFNYEQFNFPDLPEVISDALGDHDVSQESSAAGQEELEFVVLQDDPSKENR